MQIVIAGAGTVGQHIAEMLQEEQHDVAMIDLDNERLLDVGERLDIRTLHGSANNPEILREAGVARARLFLAMTQRDETNLISAMTAHHLGAHKTVARVRQPFYQKGAPFDYAQLLGIDLLLSPERLTALEIVKHINQPAAIAIESFAGGQLQMQQFKMPEGHPCDGKFLIELRDKLPEGLLIAMVSHGDDLQIAKGDTVIHAGDRVTVLGRPASIKEFSATFESAEGDESIDKIFVAGGGVKGYHLARMLQGQGYHVTLMERDRERCEILSQRLEKVKIVHGDATRLPVLKEERVAKADLFVAAMGDDENNLMAGLQAKSLGVARVFTIMNRPDYAQTLEQFGIDLALSPRNIIANRTMALIRRGKIRALSIIENGRAEVMELTALAGTPAVAGPLKMLKPPRGVLIALVLREGHAEVPTGETTIVAGDTVVTLSLTQDSAAAEKFFGSEEEE